MPKNLPDRWDRESLRCAQNDMFFVSLTVLVLYGTTVFENLCAAFYFSISLKKGRAYARC